MSTVTDAKPEWSFGRALGETFLGILKLEGDKRISERYGTESEDERPLVYTPTTTPNNGVASFTADGGNRDLVDQQQVGDQLKRWGVYALIALLVFVAVIVVLKVVF